MTSMVNPKHSSKADDYIFQWILEFFYYNSLQTYESGLLSCLVMTEAHSDTVLPYAVVPAVTRNSYSVCGCKRSLM